MALLEVAWQPRPAEEAGTVLGARCGVVLLASRDECLVVGSVALQNFVVKRFIQSVVVLVVYVLVLDDLCYFLRSRQWDFLDHWLSSSASSSWSSCTFSMGNWKVGMLNKVATWWYFWIVYSIGVVDLGILNSSFVLNI